MTDLSHIRTLLDSLPLLSEDDFNQTDGRDLTCTLEGDQSPMYSLNQQETNYLHYLCMLGRIAPLKDHIEALKWRYPNDLPYIHQLLNDTSIHEHWFGTPLHTATSWNNNPTLVRYLIREGADPTITNYYDETPGLLCNSWFISPFKLGIETDDYRNNPEDGCSVSRQIGDFKEVMEYMQSLLPK